MSARSMLVFSVLGVAALGTWWKMRHASRTDAMHLQPAVDIDDDTIADIIRRALPAFERARMILTESQAYGS